MTAQQSTCLILNKGCKRVDAAEKFLRLVPAKYTVEAIEEPDGTLMYCIIRRPNAASLTLRHVDIAIPDGTLLLPDDALLNWVVVPACTMLGGM